MYHFLFVYEHLHISCISSLSKLSSWFNGNMHVFVHFCFYFWFYYNIYQWHFLFCIVFHLLFIFLCYWNYVHVFVNVVGSSFIFCLLTKVNHYLFELCIIIRILVLYLMWNLFLLSTSKTYFFKLKIVIRLLVWKQNL